MSTIKQEGGEDVDKAKKDRHLIFVPLLSPNMIMKLMRCAP